MTITKSLGARAGIAITLADGTVAWLDVTALTDAAGNVYGAGNAFPVSSINPNSEYETVAASATDQALGATGATGDYLSHVIIVPATAAAGAVSIKDGAGTLVTIFAGGGTTALPTLAPITVFLGMKSLAGAWKVTTGTNVSAIGVGDFT